MKRCPECGRDYNDDSMSFCLDDGSELLFGPGSGALGAAKTGGPAETALLPTLPNVVLDSRASIGQQVTEPLIQGRDTLIPRSKRRFGYRYLWLIGSLAIAGVVTAGYLFYAGPANQISTLAVMPFVYDGVKPDSEYLSDGMTETLIATLSRLPNLSVKARSSVFRYKAKEVDPKVVGRELNVQAVLNGRIVERANSLILYLSLVDTQTGDQLWGEQYSKQLSDVLSLQTEIGRDVAFKLRTRLSGADRNELSKRYTQNTEAYEHYLMGRYLWNKRNVESLRNSLTYFEKAISIDPNYALGYAGLADGYSLLYYYGGASAHDALPKAKESALKAIALDDNLAEPHYALALVLMFLDHDYAGAERENRRALAINPAFGLAHLNLGVMLNRIGRHTEGMSELRTALELEPFSLPVNRTYGDILVHTRRYEEAEAHLKKTLQLDQSFPTTHLSLATLYQVTGRYAESVESYATYLDLTGKANSAALARDAFRSRQWQGYLEAMTGSPRPTGVSPYFAATLFLQRNRPNEAIAELERAYESRDHVLLFIKLDPRLDGLRDDGRLDDLVKRLRFP